VENDLGGKLLSFHRIMADNSLPIKAQTNYNCNDCDFNSSNKKDYNRHILTAKHLRIINNTNFTPGEYQCVCGKKYKHMSGLCKHKHKCKPEPQFEENIQTTIEPIEPNSAELLILVKELMIQMAMKNKHQDELIAQMAAKDKQQDVLIKQNQELQNTMKEMIPHLGNNNNTNSNNTFNVQLYLETECKDAVSIQEFIKNIEINMSHLVAMTKDGYVDSMSNVLIQALNKMAVTDRPLHCTDLKRETVYIKDMETWNKSTADAPLMNGLINSIENKHYFRVKQYTREHPQALVLDTPEYNFYAKACVHSCGNYEDHDKLNKKICKKVLPEIKLDKTTAS
jgi:hypothetical protein